MNKRFVDTSVVVKWIVYEEGSDAAAALFGTPLVAADLVQAELANALWKKRRRKQISAEQALAGFAEACARLDFLNTASLAQRALEIALEIDHPVYDCFLLALSEVVNMPLITADEGLLRSCAGTWFAMLVEPLALTRS
ncbi:MAG: type II toxin-antitoxin system VapC family toxin [Sphingomonas sp.]